MGVLLAFAAASPAAFRKEDVKAHKLDNGLKILFLEDEFAKKKKTRVDSLKAVDDNPGAAARDYFQKAYFGSHPPGHIPSGAEVSLERMTATDVRAYCQKYCRKTTSCSC